MKYRRLFLICILGAGVCCSASQASSSMGVNIYGLCRHIDRIEAETYSLKETNPGVGLCYSHSYESGNMFRVEAGTFKDSFRRSAEFASAGYLVRTIGQLRMGGLLALYYSKSYWTRAVLVPVPVVSYRLPLVTLNCVYLMEFGSRGVLGGYVTVRFWER